MPVNDGNLRRYRKIFQECDTNQDGLVSFCELKHYLKSKNHSKDLPLRQIKHIFSLEGKDGGKLVTFEEFVEIVEHPDLQFLFGHYVNRYVNFLVPQPKPEPKKKFHIRGRAVRFSYTVSTTEVGPNNQRRTSVGSAELQLLQSSVKDHEEDDEISYLDELTFCPPPIAMILITIMEIVFFLTDELVQKGSTLSGTGVTAQIFLYEPSKRQQAWRFLTYMFVHIGYVHIVVNMAFQLLLGLPLEMVHRWWRVSLLYFAGVIAGSLATSVTDPWVRLAGASGGVYALLTAHISTIIINWSEMTMPYLQLGILLIIVGFDLGSSIYDRYFLNIHNQVGYAAHFGGAVAGLLVGIYLLRNLNVKKCEKYLWWAALVIYVVLMTVAILMNIFLPGRYPPRAN
ncbi:hypothetical protein ABEB36_006974 [Hypothenemus hampei]|uniref:EF-hand domain-containing protein n=1 Tax=Hypothenemus hampei TaxID=57062 RepID=A0ABD1ESE9_HYPHA